MGQLLWVKLAEDLDITSVPDHGKIEGMCVSGSLVACGHDLMTYDPMPTVGRGCFLSEAPDKEV